MPEEGTDPVTDAEGIHSILSFASVNILDIWLVYLANWVEAHDYLHRCHLLALGSILIPGGLLSAVFVLPASSFLSL